MSIAPFSNDGRETELQVESLDEDYVASMKPGGAQVEMQPIRLDQPMGTQQYMPVQQQVQPAMMMMQQPQQTGFRARLRNVCKQ